MRLDKYLAEASIGTKKVVREYVKNKRVHVNNELITEASTLINELEDEVLFDNERVINSGKVYYMFNKPAGCVTARSDMHKKTVMDYFQDINNNGLFPVGRLDMDTEGLLFFTNDGDFDHMLMHPKHHVDKTYFFCAIGGLSDEDIIKIETGISISKEDTLTKPAKLKIDKRGTYQDFKDEINNFIIDKNKIQVNNQEFFSGYLTISEGQKHQVKRMLRAVGCYVVYLKRIKIGEICLDENLKSGEYRALTKKELEGLYFG